MNLLNFHACIGTGNDKGLPSIACIGSPTLNGFILTTAEQILLMEQGRRPNPMLMPSEGLLANSLVQIPLLNGAIATTAIEHLPVLTKFQGQHNLFVAR